MKSFSNELLLVLMMIVGMVVWAPSIQNLLPNYDLKYRYIPNEPNLILQARPESSQTLRIMNESFSNYIDLNNEYVNLATKVVNFLNNETLLKDNRQSSLLATYLTISTLLYLNHSVAMQYKEGIYQYLLSKMDVASHFGENIPYEQYQAIPEALDDLNFAPYTSNLTHHIALWTLGKLDLLARFSPTQIDAWIAEIHRDQHPDGGWGTIRAPNASLVETYYAIGALQGLYATRGIDILTSTKQSVEAFLLAHQSKAMFPFYGIFFDNSTYLANGWSKFLTSWSAVQVIRMIGSDPAQYNANFTTFMRYPVFNNASQSFADQVNDLSDKYMRNYGGTAIIGDCLYGLKLQTTFAAELTEATANLITDSPETEMFRFSNITNEQDLGNQYWILHYLNQSNQVSLLSQTKRNFLAEMYQGFFTLEGGASFQSNNNPSLSLIASLSDYVRNFAGVNKSHLFELIMSFEQQFLLAGANRSWFQDRRGFTGMLYETCSKFEPYAAEQSAAVTSTYFALKTLTDYGLMDTFYARVGARFAYFERWAPSKLHPNGYFLNHTNLPNTGDLQSTYYALAGQKILLDYNYRSFDYYYSTNQKTAIRNYVLMHIINNESEWYARCGGMTNFAATFYAQQILELLGFSSDIVYPYLYTYIMQQIEDLPQYSVESQKDLYMLVKPNLNSITFNSKLINHGIITSLISFNETCPKLINHVVNLQLLSEVYPIRNHFLIINMQVPRVHIFNQEQLYAFQLISLTSVENCEIVSLSGESGTNFTISNMGNYYQAQVLPEFTTSHPELWRVTIMMKSGGNCYYYNWTQSILIPFHTQINPGYSAVEIIIDSPSMVLNSLHFNFSSPNQTLTYISPTIILESNRMIYRVPLNTTQRPKGIYQVNLFLSGGVPSALYNASNGLQGIEYVVFINNTVGITPSDNTVGLQNMTWSVAQYIWIPASGIGGVIMVVQAISMRKQLVLMDSKNIKLK